MWPVVPTSIATLLTLSASASASTSFTNAHGHNAHAHAAAARAAGLRARNIVYDNKLKDSYDFVIVGGGTAGLVLGARLSEDSNHTVLVLEAGHSGDAVVSTIDVPHNTYYDSLTKSEYDWAYSTAAQAGLDNRNLPWPRGKVLGGSSAINGLYAVRPAEVEVDAWKDLLEGADGADNWSWNSLYEAMKKSETFTAPSDEIATTAGITYDASLHGTDGPMHNSYPGYQLELNGEWQTALASIGIDSRKDGNGGENWGAFVTTSYINPANWTRSYTRNSYLDPLPPRDNFDVLADAQVTRLLFESGSGDLKANGVEYASARDQPTSIIKVNKEVILAAGVVGSPQVLMLSGVGPRDVLESVGIEVKNELPGVGQHLQDHLVTAVYFSTNTTTAGSLRTGGLDTPEFGSYINSATAYVNLTAILGESARNDFLATISDAAAASAALVPSTSSEVVTGYKNMYAKALDLLQNTQVGSIELLFALTGDGTFGVQAGLQHPFSPGHISLNSSSAFDYPIIDPGYLSHSADLTVLREGIKLARKVGQTTPIKDAVIAETFPGDSVQTDEEWETWLKQNLGTEYHPRGSCSMLPKASGGVIDPKLFVYGTSNVRIADSSIFPIDMSCHLEAPTIGVAEKAAEIIRAAYTTGTTSSTSQSTGGSSNQNTSASSGNADGALALSAPWAALVAGVVSSMFL
ncbi:GMC oxidoreductase [Cylindrobasidium torrendii FP15055 ss-10]|uniref:GMC oxidoreductase n=1 Tax=Cylindrobasidium torrendii FP15055 ss-10 TaxID=1314674 RepID=A0A0D7AV64_9AGAR|nr:GMC oxidoreductase [Cylindrobasidium torrendii FP15055 ss-10]